MKKILSLVLALMMVFAVTTAFAGTIVVETGKSASDGTESQNVLKGETYNAYKILNYTTDGNDAFSYYLTTAQYDADNNNGLGKLLESVGFEFTASSDGTLYYVSNTDSITDAANVANGLYNIKSKIAAVALASASTEATADRQAVFSNLDIGYWFVTSSLGALTSLQSYDAENVIVEKNTKPTVDKKEKLEADPNYVEGPIDTHFGETVNYQIVITDGTGTNADLTMTDTMTDGLDYTAGSLKINGAAVADDANNNNWQVTVNNRTITIVFKAAYVGGLNSGDTITVTYDATINENAVIDSATGNKNEVEIEFSHQTDTDQVFVETYDFIVKKTDGTKFLDGAEFKLYDAATGGNQILLSKDNTGYYVDANGNANTNIVIDSENGVNVRGLEPDTYYLEEVVVPDGYNKLAARETVTVTSGQTAAVEITVVNTAGTILPSTGGIGTTIFYVLGGILVIGAAVILVARRKAHE